MKARGLILMFFSVPASHTPQCYRKTTSRRKKGDLYRGGRPRWSEDDFKGLLHSLGCAGYGWLQPEGVRRELERMTASWREPPMTPRCRKRT